jgi:hypothetical protein
MINFDQILKVSNKFPNLTYLECLEEVEIPEETIDDIVNLIEHEGSNTIVRERLDQKEERKKQKLLERKKGSYFTFS